MVARRETSETAAGTEYGIINGMKASCAVNSGDPWCEEKRGESEEILSELNIDDEDFGTPFMESLQVEKIPTVDMPASRQRTLGDQRETRLLHEDLVQAQAQMNLGGAAYVRFMSTGDVEDVNKAIEHWGVAVTLLPDSLIGRLSLFSKLGSAYACRFRCLGEESDLKKAIELGIETISLAPEGHPERPGYLSNLGNWYLARFECLGDPSDLNKAVESQAQAVLLAPDGYPNKPACLNNLGSSYLTRFERIGELSDLNKAIESQAQAVLLTPDDHPNKPTCLINLGASYLARFERLGELPDLSEVVESLSQAVALAPDGDPDKPGYLNNLGSSYLTRFERMGELSDLKKAVESQAQAVSLTPDGHPNRPTCLNNLGNSYQTRFERLGELSDLNKAIESQAQAVLLAPEGHSEKPGYLNNLGASYLNRFKFLGELSDLSKAVESQAQAVFLTTEGHANKPARLNNLGSSYLTRFERMGELSDLNKAVESQTQAVSLTSEGHSNKPGYLNNLGNSYRTRFEHIGQLSDLNKAIESQAQAVWLTPDGYPDKPGYLNNLGASYRTRFERLGELPDLSEAVEFLSQAVSLTPDGHPDKPKCLINLGNSYLTRFERIGELSDLNKAIESQAQAIFLTSEGHPEKPEYLSNLGVSYRTRFDRLSQLSDLNKAIESQAQAVSLTPDDHPNKPTCLNGLGASYIARFERLGELPDLSEAVDFLSQAVSLAPDGHPDKPGYFNNLGDTYENRFTRLRASSDLQSAEESFKKASQSSTAPPYVRFYACKRWAKLSRFSPMLLPLPAYQQAMSLIPQLVWVGTTIERRYELVAEVSDFAAEAASHAISTGAHNFALEWIEAGRSIVWGQIAQLRSPFGFLSGHNPKLATHLAVIGRQLEHAGSRNSLPSSPAASSRDLGKEADTHIWLALEWDRLLKEIRELPGFEDFLCSPRASLLLSAAKAHPIAVINLHASRCDALILQPGSDTISHVALAEFSLEDAMSARRHVFSHVRDRRPGPRLNPTGSLHDPLEGVWSSVVKPVLDFLAYTRKMPFDQLPQITWCASGLLSFIPLHAARSRDDSLPSAFDLVISSYTPTLSALLSAQFADPASTCGIVAVGQETTPGLEPLPCTTTELAVIQKHTQSGYYLQLENDEATVEQVLDAMDQFSWVHMACHGSQDTYDPTHSSFHLHDGNLTLAAITKRSFTNKGLAFLSACQTATGDENMPDEAVHLAAGMLVAGYPSVIGTMWSIADEDGPEVADMVYAELLKDGAMDHTKSARALHQAVARLRKKVGEKDIARWAPFIHIGC